MLREKNRAGRQVQKFCNAAAFHTQNTNCKLRHSLSQGQGGELDHPNSSAHPPPRSTSWLYRNASSYRDRPSRSAINSRDAAVIRFLLVKNKM